MIIEKILVSTLKQSIKQTETKIISKITNPNIERDIFEPIRKEIPVFKGSDVSMHHELNGINPDIRNFLENPNSKRNKGREYLKEYIEEIDKEFENLPPLESNYTVWRGRTKNPIIKRFNKDFEIIENAKAGDIIVPDAAYSYTAFHKALAQNWGGSSNNFNLFTGKLNRQILYEINLPKGAKVSRNMEHGGEVVMPRGAQYKIIEKTTDKYGCTHVKMDYILPE